MIFKSRTIFRACAAFHAGLHIINYANYSQASSSQLISSDPGLLL